MEHYYCIVFFSLLPLLIMSGSESDDNFLSADEGSELDDEFAASENNESFHLAVIDTNQKLVNKNECCPKTTSLLNTQVCNEPLAEPEYDITDFVASDITSEKKIKNQLSSIDKKSDFDPISVKVFFEEELFENFPIEKGVPLESKHGSASTLPISSNVLVRDPQPFSPVSNVDFTKSAEIVSSKSNLNTLPIIESSPNVLQVLDDISQNEQDSTVNIDVGISATEVLLEDNISDTTSTASAVDAILTISSDNAPEMTKRGTFESEISSNTHQEFSFVDKPRKTSKIGLKKPREKLSERMGARRLGTRAGKTLEGISCDSLKNTLATDEMLCSKPPGLKTEDSWEKIDPSAVSNIPEKVSN